MEWLKRIIRFRLSFTRLAPYVWGLAVAWALIGTLMMGGLLAWNVNRQKQETIQVALNEARTVYKKDLIYYRWATGHHGVYVPITGKTRPNPYLAHIKEATIPTTFGKNLTLINPEYMIRQVYEMQSGEIGPIEHITSLDPIRPENMADPWEQRALKAFEKGVKEVHSVERIDGKLYLRLMRPMVAEKGCLKCHPGYRVGDIRGGISVSIPMAPLLALTRSHIWASFLAHVSFWLLGLIGIFLATYWITQSIREREEAEARTRAIIDNMLDGLITIDEKGNITSFNPAASRLFGYSQEEVLGMNICQLVNVIEKDGDPEDGTPFTSIDCLKKSIIRVTKSPYELLGRRKDGTTFPVEISLSEMKLGETRLAIAMIRDITERKKAEEALRETQAHIIKQEKLASLGTMVAGIAHEINNPAQAIGFSMEGLRENIGYLKEIISQLKRFLSSSDQDRDRELRRLKELMEELDIDFTLEAIDDIAERNIESVGRIDKIIKSTKRMAHFEENFTTCHLNTIINDAITLTHNQVKYDMTIETDLAPDLPPFKGMAQELGQVFINFIINARDAIKEKGLSPKEGKLKISTRYNPETHWLEASFEDNGIGIKKEIFNKIFDPFFTTKKIGQGTGLGLNLSHVIVEAHGGQIKVKSEYGKGACFTVLLKADLEQEKGTGEKGPHGGDHGH